MNNNKFPSGKYEREKERNLKNIEVNM